jgi:hypothetical protein
MTRQLIPAYSGFRGGPIGKAYNEAAFKYFLDADRRRVERTERSIILVLVSVRQDPGHNAPLTDAVAARLFDGLAASVREVDFVGWYREGRIAGAVLPQAVGPSSELREVIAKRILISLKRVVSADLAACLHVRVVRVGGKEQR